MLNRFFFKMPTQIRYGLGVSGETGIHLQQLGGTKVLLITDHGVQQAGLLEEVTRAIEDAEATIALFDEVEPNPRDTTVERAAALGQQIEANAIVAVGGGSVIDAAKAAGVLLTHDGQIRDYEGRGRVLRPITPLIAIPTTSGTGSEITFSSVITDTLAKYKFSINSPLATASVALLDPGLTVTLPPSTTAYTGMDALTHAIEGMTATVSNPISEMLALNAIGLISSNIKTATYEGSNVESRSAMLMGSLLAGMSFANADVAAVHCMAEALGGLYDIPHGLANSIFLPYVMEYNLKAIPDKTARIASAMGIDTEGLSQEEAANIAVAQVKQLSTDLKIPTFRDLAIDDLDLNILASMAGQNGSVSSNPMAVGEEDFLDLFKKALRDGGS